MASRLHLTAWRAALLAAVLGSLVAWAVAPPVHAAGDDPAPIPLRYVIKVTKSGKGTRLDRLAISYPTSALLTTTCRRGDEAGGPCPADAAPVDGLICQPADGAPETTKCELRSTKARPLWYPRGEAMYFSLTQPGSLSTSLSVSFAGPGRYRAVKTS